jgi:hypothetical protein
VHALQAQYQVRPLSAHGKPYTFKARPVDPDPGFSMTEAPQKAILALGTSGYFKLLARLMGSEAPAPAQDAPMLERMAQLGIVPGQPFEPGNLDPAVLAALEDVPEVALEKMVARWDSLGRDVNGWRVTTVGGRYGTDYLERGACRRGQLLTAAACFGLSTTSLDSEGRRLDGAHRTLTFAKDAMLGQPHGVLSITMYTEDDGLWFYPNPLNKLTVSPRDKPV